MSGGWTALMCACKHSLSDVALKLIENGCDLNVQGKAELEAGTYVNTL